MTLIEFLLARIAEDEVVARAALTDGNSNQIWQVQDWIELDAEVLAHVHRHDPHRVLAECEAKRRIVAMWLDEARFPDFDCGWEVLQMLARSYADHPDYCKDWRQ